MTEREDDGPGFGKVRRTLRRIRLQRGGSAAPILIRRSSTPPEVALAMRGLLVLLLIFAVFSVFLLDREGLRDNIDGNVSLIDVIHFTMITITTVGYGDIVPVSDQARLIDAFFVTPPRFGGVMMADAVESRTTVDFVSELMTYRGSRRIGLWNEKNLRIEGGDRLLAIDSDAVLRARLA